MIDVIEKRRGLYEGLSFDEYCLWDAANASTLKHMARSPAHADYYHRHPTAETDAQRWGHAIHAGVLEPKTFARRYVRGLSGENGMHLPRVSKVNKALWEKFDADLGPDVISVLKPQEWDPIIATVNAVRRNPFVLELLSGGRTEVAALADLHGVPCKARIDLLTTWDGWTVVVDLKTCPNASYGAVKRDISRFTYHLQASFYLAVLNALAPMPRRFLHIFTEKDAPHESAVYEIDAAGLDVGAALWSEYLQRWAACREADNWPGYSDAIEQIGLMEWAQEPFDIRNVG